jgi:lipoprotein NlpD
LVLTVVACAPWEPRSDPSRPGASGPPTRERAAEAPPDLYEVRRGDTLYSIAFRYGLNWRDVAAWNGIDAPYTIRPGQELRMSRPPRPEPQPETEDPPARETEPATSSAEPDPEPTREAPQGSAPSRTVGGVSWQWPTEGRVSRPFDPAATRKGIGLSGDEGQAVFAAAAGEVVYSGTALIGYGELIIIKHSSSLLSAYGHNRRRLVGEGDRVARGQPIAEMGLGDRREPMLHFEIRKDGEPVNPVDYLPDR